MKYCKLYYLVVLLALTDICFSQQKPVQYSGIYPHLAYYNNEGECGGGAVVPWAGKLWLISYAPHKFYGSSDKLYEIDPNLIRKIRNESVGGTPANRLIHNESQQLFIGPYVIDKTGNVRVIPPSVMPGRLTGAAKHLTDPFGKIYIATMEEGFYEINVKTLEVKIISTDENVDTKKPELLKGYHGKGLYSGQGHLYYANNGERGKEAEINPHATSGVLAEWDGNVWKTIQRKQFTEITGPGGIWGAKNPETDPIWSIGWDDRSLILMLRDNNTWKSFRLPKASHSYDGAHGWNTEWHRIRDIGKEGNPDLLMTMHGMFWKFPITFSSANLAGIRPRSSYLKIIGDFCRWNDKIVCACDDAAHDEFLNKRNFKGGCPGPGQSQSNLWFIEPSELNNFGPTTANGAVWLKDSIREKTVSEPFLLAGWENRSIQIGNNGDYKVKLLFEIDELGNGKWKRYKTVTVQPKTMKWIKVKNAEQGEWVRAKALQACKNLTVMFNYSSIDKRDINKPSAIFEGLANLNDRDCITGIVLTQGENKRGLYFISKKVDRDTLTDNGHYVLDSLLAFNPISDSIIPKAVSKSLNIAVNGVSLDESSVLLIDDKGKHWRLPKGNTGFDEIIKNRLGRIDREIVTERDIFNCHGTFYELPAENAGGVECIRPITSHNYKIMDFCSYRGMMVLTGINPNIKNPHLVYSSNSAAAVWLGTIDNLWKMGKPHGIGGPWKNTKVTAFTPSDPYLINGYDKKHLTLNTDKDAVITIEVNFNHQEFYQYKNIKVKANVPFEYDFPEGYSAYWIRFTSSLDCTATAQLVYK
jgi:hypothetical protein